METMPDEKTKLRLEIAHVLFVDIVGYSNVSIDDQRRAIERLNNAVQQTEESRESEATSRSVKIPTGDGMALVFYDSPESPVESAMDIAANLSAADAPRLRMGIHSGPVSGVVDVNGRANVAGEGINVAQRVMDCGDAGHILLSKRVADDLAHSRRWQPCLHDFGEVEVKHGARIHIFNLYTGEIGNAELPEKLQRKNGSSAPPKTSRSSARLSIAASAAIFIVIVGLWLFHSRSEREASARSAAAEARIPDKSVAVLPFENLSTDPDNAYFATGIQDEILTHLAKLGALKVISRTSTQQYTARPGNLREIAKQLGVGNILEGSVQRTADRVHINVQLVRAATDEHLWAETYDRKLDNIFNVEGEVAAAVAQALKATLTGSERRALTKKATSNPAAYDAYLRGLNYSVHDDIPANNIAAIKSYRQAVELDPSFALAWARLARASAFAFYGHQGEDVALYRDTARQASDMARRLAPDAPETSLADGYVQYYCDLNYDAAIKSFERAGQLSPNNSQVLRALALCYRRKLQWDKSLDYFRQAAQLDPRDTELLGDQADTMQLMHQLPAALTVIDAILKIIPGDPQTLGTKVEILQDMGDLAAARALLAPLHPAANTYLFYKGIDQLILERKYPEAITAFKVHLSADVQGEPAHYAAYVKSHVAQVTKWSGDNATAQKLWQEVRTELEPLYSPDTDDVYFVQSLALAIGELGESKRAVAMMQQLTDVLLTNNPLDALNARSWLAKLEAQLGNQDAAIEQLTALLKIPSPLNAGDLRHNPVWDPLRSDPRFAKIAGLPKPQSAVPK